MSSIHSPITALDFYGDAEACAYLRVAVALRFAAMLQVQFGPPYIVNDAARSIFRAEMRVAAQRAVKYVRDAKARELRIAA